MYELCPQCTWGGNSENATHVTFTLTPNTTTEIFLCVYLERGRVINIHHQASCEHPSTQSYTSDVYDRVNKGSVLCNAAFRLVIQYNLPSLDRKRACLPEMTTQKFNWIYNLTLLSRWYISQSCQKMAAVTEKQLDWHDVIILLADNHDQSLCQFPPLINIFQYTC